MGERAAAVEIKSGRMEAYARYALETIFCLLGFPFRLVDRWQDPIIRVVHDEVYREPADLFIPACPYEPWTKGIPKVAFLGDIPVLYVMNKPAELVQDGRLGFDLVNSVFYLLSRQEEYAKQGCKASGSFAPDRSVLGKYRVLGKPVIDHYVRVIRRDLEERVLRRGLNLKPVPMWKDECDFAVCLTHDIDRIGRVWVGKALKYLFNKGIVDLQWQEVYSKTMRLLKRRKGKLDPSAAGLERIVELEDLYGVRSTWFVSNLQRRHPSDPKYDLHEKVRFRGKSVRLTDLLRTLIAEGWEVGLHGSSRSYRDERLQIEEKERIEELLGHKIAGQRQHRLLFAQLDTWLAQERAGFEYDSTLGYNDRIGFRAGISFPFYPYDRHGDRKLSMLEVPVVLQDGALFHREDGREGGRSCSRSERKYWELVSSAVEEVESTGGLLTLIWHNDSIIEKFNDELLELYAEILAYLLRKKAYVAPLQDLVGWWKERERVVMLR